MLDALPPEIFIPAKPAIVRAHQGDLNALAALEREHGIKAMLPGMMPVISQSKSVSGSHTAGVTNASVTTGHTYNSVAIGAAPAAGETRDIFVCIGVLTGAGAPTGVTCNGNSMTLVAGVTNHASQTYSAIYRLAVATGTTANFFVATPGASQAAIAVYRVVGVGSITATANDTSDPISMSLATAPRGFAIATTMNRNRGAATWSGGLTEDYDVETGTTDFMSSASSGTTGSTLSIGVASTGGNEISGVAVSLQP
jgi:hypothetical protein